LSSVQSHKIIGGEKEAQESAGGSSLVDVRPLNDGLDQETLDILEKVLLMLLMMPSKLISSKILTKGVKI